MSIFFNSFVKVLDTPYGQEELRSLWDLWEYAFYFLSQNLGNVVYYTVLQRLLLSMRMKNLYANRLSKADLSPKRQKSVEKYSDRKVKRYASQI